MVVGVCVLTFSLPGNASLKGKRSVVRRIVDRTRAKFNAAVAEVSDMGVHQRAVIGVSVVSNDTRHANSMLDKISAFMASSTEAVLIERTLDLLHANGEPTGLPGVLIDAGYDPDWERN
ncbi:MAG TPA: DUF503 domain-containing protein, partial [Polyangiales bacterium]|nr:DUF503 domain-containing protein [Polyangiales bacterium]